MKRDAPSGTALALGEAIARARGAALAELAVFDRHGMPGPRKPGSIGFACCAPATSSASTRRRSPRTGERIELTHRATDRMVFARGALAGRRVAGWPPAGALRHAGRARVCEKHGQLVARIVNIRARKLAAIRIYEAGGRS